MAFGLIQAQAHQQQAQQIHEFRAFTAPLQVKFIDHQREAVALVVSQPATGLLQHSPLAGATQHGIEHADVSDQDVRSPLLHVPASKHLATVDRRKGKGGFALLRSLFPAGLLIGAELQLSSQRRLKIIHPGEGEQHLLDPPFAGAGNLGLPLFESATGLNAWDQLAEWRVC
ncbi:MAG: hypothetical protein ACKN89_10725 [Cyanobium sp.]